MTLSVLQKLVLAAELGEPGQSGYITYIHDYSLDGDEDLAVGKRVEVTDGTVTAKATVVKRDDASGFWYLRID